MTHKISIPLYHEDVAPRFDMATEVLILTLPKGDLPQEKKTIILPRSSADDLCYLLLSERTNTLICGAVEEEYYQFLKWKKIEIFDSIAGSWIKAFENWQKKTLHPGDILSQRMVERKNV